LQTVKRRPKHVRQRQLGDWICWPERQQ